jgi:signal transduction histidine kinase
MEDYGIDKYLEFFFSIYNPIFLALIFFLLLFVVIYISYRHIYHPLIKKHRKEKESLELKNAKLLTLFTELDPNPIIKIDPNGFIVGMNKCAKEKFNLAFNAKNKIDTILESVDFNVKDLIGSNKSIIITKVLQNRHYEINIHGISLLDMAQLYFYDVTEKIEHAEQMNSYQKVLKESSAKSIKDLEEERSRLAALLHDSIGQNLLLIKLGIQNLKKYLNGRESQEEFSNTLGIIDSTIKETKDISRSIRPLNLDELGLKTVLTSLCKNVARESLLEFQVNLPDDNITLDKELENCIYRVTQESLNNIIKHSRAKTFEVNLYINNGSVTLIISDDGIGFKPSILLNNKYISDGLGILNMQERIERLSGTFHIDSTIDYGTILIASFPQTEEENGRERTYKTINR